MNKNRLASARSKSMNSIHEILETVVSDSLVSDVISAEVNEKLQKIQDHLRGRNIPPVTTVARILFFIQFHRSLLSKARILPKNSSCTLFFFIQSGIV